MNPILAAHCYLPVINKAETASNEDDGCYSDDNKGGDGGISSAVRVRSARVEDMRRAALVIGFGNSDLSTRIASSQSEGMGFKYVLSLEFLRVATDQMDYHRGRGQAKERYNGENGSSSNAAIVVVTWEHSDCLSIPPAVYQVAFILLV